MTVMREGSCGLVIMALGFIVFFIAAIVICTSETLSMPTPEEQVMEAAKLAVLPDFHAQVNVPLPQRISFLMGNDTDTTVEPQATTATTLHPSTTAVPQGNITAMPPANTTAMPSTDATAMPPTDATAMTTAM
nr:uncharacterized protein LOC113808833 [Penaeus vannamei]